jgi:hypothetical protein
MRSRCPKGVSYAPAQMIIGVLRWVSKGVEDDCRPPALWAATPEMAVRLFQSVES